MCAVLIVAAVVVVIVVVIVAVVVAVVVDLHDHDYVLLILLPCTQVFFISSPHRCRWYCVAIQSPTIPSPETKAFAKTNGSLVKTLCCQQK